MHMISFWCETIDPVTLQHCQKNKWKRKMNNNFQRYRLAMIVLSCITMFADWLRMTDIPIWTLAMWQFDIRAEPFNEKPKPVWPPAMRQLEISQQPPSWTMTPATRHQQPQLVYPNTLVYNHNTARYPRQSFTTVYRSHTQVIVDFNQSSLWLRHNRVHHLLGPNWDNQTSSFWVIETVALR